MKRFLIKMALAGLAIFLLGAKFVDVSTGQALEPDPLLKAWEAAGIRTEETIIDGWGMQGAKFLPLSEVEGIGRRLASQLGMRATGRPTSGEEPSLRFYTTEGELKAGTRAIITVQSAIGSNGQGSTHHGILLAGRGMIADVPDLRRKVLGLLTEGGRQGETAVAVSGTVTGKMDAATARALCTRVTSAAGGKTVSYNSDYDGITLSVFSPAMGAGIDFGGARVNLQVSIRYDSLTQKTVVVMASPMLTEMF